MDALTEFKNWWLNNRPIFVPFDAPAMFWEHVMGAVLYRAGPWQVQLFIVAPNSVISDHRHPHVDSYEVYLSGDIEFNRGGEIRTSFSDSQFSGFDGRHKCFGTDIRVVPGDWHGARVGPKGGIFLSIQHWLDGHHPSSVGEDWEAREGEWDRRNYALSP
jgi:hypothetical protein